MRFDLKPTAIGEAVFLGFIVVMIVLCFRNVTAVYSHGVVWSVGAALFISWLPMQLIALVFEHRTLLPPSSQYTSFFWGDLLLLPTIAASFAVMRQQLRDDTLADRFWWRLLCLLIGVAVGVCFHAAEAAGTSYTTSQIHSPTKLWHDLLVLPVLIYFLGSQLPLLRHGSMPIVALAAAVFVAWSLLLIVYDGSHHKPRAHINFDWREVRPAPIAPMR